jgi:3-deoxy-D-manno-octulosonate 8-phosphate phosphatase (KDO 8-P phosphatase)
MRLSRAALIKKALPIKLLAMDVDGVLTSGEIIVLESGEEIKLWNAKDRLVLSLADKCRLPFSFAWITGRSSNSVRRAAQDLGIKYLFQDCHNKVSALEDILKKENLTHSQVGFIGDDLIDLPVLRKVGFAACPSDAARDVKNCVNYQSPFLGGRGVVRDVIEFIFRAQGLWDCLAKPYILPPSS